jgi:glyoxylase-like metal-dependent hydrolase (beta-lactamase superfamily II)
MAKGRAVQHVVGPFHRLRGLIVSNVFVLDGGRGDRWIIDSGHPLERPTLLLGLRSLGFSPREITGVLLTHRHSDHAGNAAFLRRTFGLRIVAHRLDADVLDGRERAPRLEAKTRHPITHVFAAIENRTRTRVPIDQALDDGDRIGSLEVHHAPGHTAGSVLYRHEGTSSLLSGDTLLAAVPPLTFRQGMSLPHPDFAENVDEALASLRRFHEGGWTYENLLAGHGRPILGGARRAAERLLAG